MKSVFCFALFSLVFSWHSFSLNLKSGCAAFGARKTIALVSTERVFGVNCDSKIDFKKNDSNFSISVEIPVNGFKSGEPERDEKIPSLLGMSADSLIQFRTWPLPRDVFSEWAKEKKGQLKATLKIGAKHYVVNFKVKVKKLVKDYELTGELKSSFEKFGVEAPSIAGGLIAKVSPGLDLYFRINYSEIPSEVRGMD